MTRAAKDSPESLRLRVAEAGVRDVGRGLVRLEPHHLERLGARIGDVIEVTGGRPTVGRAMPSPPDQRGREVIQLDGVLRENARTALGETVQIRRIETADAIQVTLEVRDRGDTRVPSHLLEGLALCAEDRIRLALFGAAVRELRVRATRPAGPVVVKRATRIQFVGVTGEGPGERRVSYEDIGGLGREIQRVREMVELPLRHPDLFSRLGIDPPRGVLLWGPPGTGKTLIARSVAAETRASFFTVSGPEVIHKFYGESEAKLREIFDAAARKAPSIVFLDEIDAIAPKRDRVQGDVEKRVVAQLLALMDGLKDRGQVIVIGATNLPDLLDPALRRPGRFDRELAVGVPDTRGRREILEIHTRGMPLGPDVDLDILAGKTPGFVGADLAALCREAAMVTLRRIIPDVGLADGLDESVLTRLEVDRDAFTDALTEVGPSTVRELVIEVPRVHWEEVGGLGEARRRLQQAVDWPIAHRELFERAGCRPPRGILLCGEPGTGKTLLARAAATESAANFLAVRGPELLSRYVGDSERAVRELFRRVRQSAPCILFLDELDSLAPTRGVADHDSGVASRVVAQLLTEMDGIEELRGVLVLGATNRPDRLDPALRRPGRFDVEIHVGLPDEAGCLEILRIHTRARPLAGDVRLEQLARTSCGLTPAAIAAACERASLLAVEEHLGHQGDGGGDRAVGDLLVGEAHFVGALIEARDRAGLDREPPDRRP